MHCAIGFTVLVSRHSAIRNTGRLTFAPTDLPPAEHTSIHERTSNRAHLAVPQGALPIAPSSRRLRRDRGCHMRCMEPTHVGRTVDCRQFFLTTPFVPASNVGASDGNDFVALSLFDAAGKLLDAIIEEFGRERHRTWKSVARISPRRLAALRFGRLAGPTYG